MDDARFRFGTAAMTFGALSMLAAGAFCVLVAMPSGGGVEWHGVALLGVIACNGAGLGCAAAGFFDRRESRAALLMGGLWNMPLALLIVLMVLGPRKPPPKPPPQPGLEQLLWTAQEHYRLDELGAAKADLERFLSANRDHPLAPELRRRVVDIDLEVDKRRVLGLPAAKTPAPAAPRPAEPPATAAAATIARWGTNTSWSPPTTDQARRSSVQHYLSGMIFFQKGDYERARSEWGLALELDPSNPDARAGLERIDKMFGRRG